MEEDVLDCKSFFRHDRCYFDCETYSEIPIGYGTHKYAEGAEIMLVSYAFNNEPVKVWDCVQEKYMPRDLYDAFLNDKMEFVIQNSSFDQIILREVWGVHIPLYRIHDTMARARTLGLPGSLAKLCEIFKIPADKAKDKRGHDLIQLFCKPRPSNSKIRRATHETHPKEWQEFKEYAISDVESMRAIDRVCPRWNLSLREVTLWHLDRKINDKGICVDTELATSAIAAIGRAKDELNAATSEATLGILGSTSQRDRLLRYVLETYNITLPDMQSGTLERRLTDPEVPMVVKDLLRQRLQISTTSTSKYQTLLNCVSSDGRLRGTLEFCGAGRTGRWAGRKFQPQNLPSKDLLPQEDIDRGIEALKLGIAETLYPDIMKLTSSCLRGCIIAPPGKKLVVADLANIEGRVAAWLAGEKWKLQAFRDFDVGIGPDLYKLAYARSFNKDPDDVTKWERSIGKVQELFLQYQGGVGAFLTGALTYGIDLREMADAAYSNISKRIIKDAEANYRRAVKDKRDFNLAEKTYVVCDALKLMWREAHPRISSYWDELDNMVVKAFEFPGSYHLSRQVYFRKKSSWLIIRLPSDRLLCYAAPNLEWKKFTYLGIDSYSKKWKRLKAYGGKLMENLCQATARDFLTEHMPSIDKAGYEIVLTVHDELVTETDDTDEYTVEDLCRRMTVPPFWAPNIPLAADGFESYRYRKG